MRIEVDQSGRFEYTQQDTVVAFSNQEVCSILITAKIKRACIQKMRDRGVRPPRLQAMLFATALFLLLKDHISKSSMVIIDREYFGNESLIKSHLINLFYRARMHINPDIIQFDLVGKKSPAHKIAIETFRGKRNPDKIISEAEILREL